MHETESLTRFQSRLLMAIHGITRKNLDLPERDGAWSIRDVIAHLGDFEILTAVRLRLMLAEEVPALPPFARDLWVARLHRGATVDDLLEDLWSARRRNVALLESLTGDELTRAGQHPTYGPVTVARVAEMMAEHQERHLKQIERIKTVLGLTSSDSFDVSAVTAAEIEAAPVRSPGPGIRIRDLWRRGVRHALHVELDPGAVWPSVDHHVPGPEEVYVISGQLGDGVNTYAAGTFLHHPAGSSHVPQSRTGCALFVYYPEG